MNLHDPQLRKAARWRATPACAPGAQHVAVLMAVRNGADWLPDQLSSLATQSHRDWSLMVGDDRSSDNSAEIIHDFAMAHPNVPVRLFPGPNKGFQSNFLSLLQKVSPSAAFVAFADQDDVWKPNKLKAAIAALTKMPKDKPALYCGRTEVSDANLQVCARSPLFVRRPSFQNALVQSLAGGNTMVMNAAAAKALKAAYNPQRPPVSHDWWAYQIVSGLGGNVLFDPVPHVIYRQHRRNLVGAGVGVRAKVHRLVRLSKGDLKRYSDINIAALYSARDLFTRDAQVTFDHFVKARKSAVFNRITSMRAAGVYRQTLAGSFALFAATLFARI